MPGSDTGPLLSLVGGLANRLRAITGKGSWRDTPDATLADAATHHGRADNPHSVTRAQLGAAAQTALSSHTADQSNPHGVTLEQIGALSDAYVPQWDDIEGKPASYPSSWSEVSDKPSSFTPGPHKSSHASGGADAIAPADIRAGYPPRVYIASDFAPYSQSFSAGWAAATLVNPRISVPALGAAPSGYAWRVDVEGAIRFRAATATPCLLAINFNSGTTKQAHGGAVLTANDYIVCPISIYAQVPPSISAGFTVDFLFYAQSAANVEIFNTPSPAVSCYLVRA